MEKIITPANVFDDLNYLMSNEGIFSSNPLSINKDVQVNEPKQPYFKGKGEHSVNELEKICQQYKDYVYHINSQPKVEDNIWDESRRNYKKITHRSILSNGEHALLDYLEQHYTLIKK